MRALLLIAVALAVPRPADAKMSLARSAQALCGDESLDDPDLPRTILEKSGGRGIVPVTAATVTGKFAGTPTGDCVERVVKTATFPVAQEFRTPYPFQLK